MEVENENVMSWEIKKRDGIIVSKIRYRCSFLVNIHLCLNIEGVPIKIYYNIK